MNANKALELGFADGILQDEKRQMPGSEATFAFSRRAVTNSLLDKLRPKGKPKQLETPQGVSASTLEQRLNLIIH